MISIILMHPIYHVYTANTNLEIPLKVRTLLNLRLSCVITHAIMKPLFTVVHATSGRQMTTEPYTRHFVNQTSLSGPKGVRFSCRL